MNWSSFFIPLERNISSEIVAPSHRLMIKAGLIQQVGAGVYAYSPLGLRVLRNIERVVRQEMEAIDCHEMLMPALQPVELWQASGRINTMKDVLVHAQGQNLADHILGPTHEELVTTLVASKLMTWRKFPMRVFQIQTKFRGEPRPQFGLIRTREFQMKDAYSFHATTQCLDETYQAMAGAYENIFKRCGINATKVDADPGVMGGAESAEFVAGDLELGHIFKLGEKYSHAFKTNFQDANGQLHPVLMGCYGIGIGRLMAAIVEQNHDANGIVWPNTVVSPFGYLISLLDKSDPVLLGLEYLKDEIREAKLDFLVDDRDERPGVKFNDADLLGMDRVTLGKRGAELKVRKTGETKDVTHWTKPRA